MLQLRVLIITFNVLIQAVYKIKYREVINMAKELGTRRFYVNKEAYLSGNRIVKTDDEMTDREKEQFRANFTDNLLRAFGFVKKSEVNNNNAG